MYIFVAKAPQTGRNSKIVRPRYVEETPTGFFTVPAQAPEPYILLN